jgi:hypothetical protein
MNRHLDTMRTRAKQAEAALARVRDTTHRMRATSPQGAAAIYADRIEQAIADDPYALTPEQTAAHLAFGAAADSTEARLAEQQRAHEIELATVRRNAKQLGEALAVTRSKLHDTRARRDDARAGREDAERRGDRAEEQLAAAHRRGDGWRNHALEADHRADRYRTAWFAARRDRKADRAAMAAELPLVEAARSLLTSRAPQQLARP